MEKIPMISVMIWTYNRAHLVERAINSVLKQTFQDFELILVNNGSQDNTREVLEKYADNKKVRLFHLEENIGLIGGWNFALDQIRGEWFTEMGDDDEIAENAFERMLKVLDEVDPSINAITCNGITELTGGISGFGLDKDQYLPLEKIISKTEGNFWGITKTELLGNKRLNPELIGHECTFYYQIDAIANRYYIHEFLFTRDIGQTTRASERSQNTDIDMWVKMHRELLKEDFYLNVLKKYNNKKFKTMCINGLYCMAIDGNEEGKKKYRQLLLGSHPNLFCRIIAFVATHLNKSLLRNIYRFTFPLKPFLKKIAAN